MIACMGLTSNKFSFTRPSGGGLVKEHHTNLLDHVMVDGKIRIYTDSTKGAKREEISLPTGGKIVLLKDFLVDPKQSKYKAIQIYSEEDELLDTISIVEESQIHVFRFYYGNGPIGRGWGDIGMFIAQKMLGEGVLDPRYVAGASVDQDVIDIIQKIVQRKTI